MFILLLLPCLDCLTNDAAGYGSAAASCTTRSLLIIAGFCCSAGKPAQRHRSPQCGASMLRQASSGKPGSRPSWGCFHQTQLPCHADSRGPKLRPEPWHSFLGTQCAFRLDHRSLLSYHTRWASALFVARRGDRLSHLFTEKTARSHAASNCRENLSPAITVPLGDG